MRKTSLMKACNPNHLKHAFVKKLLAAEAIFHRRKFQGLHSIQREKMKSGFTLAELLPASFDLLILHHYL